MGCAALQRANTALKGEPSLGPSRASDRPIAGTGNNSAGVQQDATQAGSSWQELTLSFTGLKARAPLGTTVRNLQLVLAPDDSLNVVVGFADDDDALDLGKAIADFKEMQEDDEDEEGAKVGALASEILADGWWFTARTEDGWHMRARREIGGNAFVIQSDRSQRSYDNAQMQANAVAFCKSLCQASAAEIAHAKRQEALLEDIGDDDEPQAAMSIEDVNIASHMLA